MTAREQIEPLVRKAVAPRSNEPVWKWAERHVLLNVRTTNAPGRYRSDWCVFTRTWQEAFSDPRIREITICAASQVGKTESLLNCVRYVVANDPGPLLWVMPAESLARSFSETRLQPSLRDCAPCAAQIPDDPDLFKLCEMHFRNCTLNLVGSNSPAQLSSRPVRFLVADECDKFNEPTAKESGALELARVRTSSFWNRKIILTSTPTVEGGQIWQAYWAGTRHKFFVKCPFCLFEQELLFPQIKWPHDERTQPSGTGWNTSAVEELAYYECASCRASIAQRQKQNMIRHGTWKATNPTAPADRVSFHLNALYSPFRSWGSIAREFLEVKDSPSGLQNFTNSVLAEPWRVEVAEAIDEARLLELRAEYALGSCPVKPHFVTLAGDVQRDSVFYTVRAWGQDGESWLLDYGKLPTLESLNEVLAREYKIEGTTETVKVSKGLVDSGYNSEAVYSFCWHSRGKLHPAKGWEQLAQPVKMATVNVAGGSHRGAFAVALWHFDDSAFKQQLYINTIQDRKGPRWHLPHNIGSDFISQLTAEKLVERKNAKGVPVQTWHRIRRDNHYGDCEKMQAVQGHLLAPELKAKPAEASSSSPSTPEGERQPTGRRGGLPRASNWIMGWK